MKSTVSLKLLDPPEEVFRTTLEAFQDACQIVSTRLESGELRPNSRAIQLATYHDLAFLPATADTGLTLTCGRDEPGTPVAGGASSPASGPSQRPGRVRGGGHAPELGGPLPDAQAGDLGGGVECWRFGPS